MRTPQEEKVNFKDLLDDISTSDKAIKILPVQDPVKEKIKEKYDIKWGSLLGVILDNTGGIVIDNWIRIYGAGEVDLAARNELFPFDNLAIAEDILGGIFVFLESGNIGYFAPDYLEVEDMEIRFNQFLYWCIHGDTDTFYIDYRWENWKEDASDISCSEGVAFYPFLWANAKDLESRKRSKVPIDEIIRLEFDFLAAAK